MVDDAAFHPSLRGDGTGEQRRVWRPALLAFAAKPSSGRRCWHVRVPPDCQPTWIDVAHTERCQRLPGGRGAAERMRAATREATEQTSQCQRIGGALVGRRQGVERRLLPTEAPGGLRERVGQGASTGAERGERRRGGQAGVAEGQIERVHLDMTMGEPAGGLSEREARRQPVAHCVVRRGGARVQPGQCVAGIGQRREQHRQVRARAPIAITGCGWLPANAAGADRRPSRPGCPPRADGAARPRRPRRRTACLRRGRSQAA